MQTKKKKAEKAELIQVNAPVKKFLNLRTKISDHFLHAAMIILMLFSIIMVGGVHP